MLISYPPRPTTGPIVRISPEDLHINDPEFTDVIFTGVEHRRNKTKWIGRSLILPDSTVATIPHELHRKRRATLNPYFSHKSIRNLENVMQKGLRRMMGRIKESGQTHSVLSLNLLFKAVTSDTISEYCFGVSTNYLDHDDFNATWFHAIDSVLGMAWVLAYIPFLGPLMKMMPPSIMASLKPGLKSLWDMHQQWDKKIDEIRACPPGESKNDSVFHGIIHSDLPASEKTTKRMQQEAQMLIMGGQDPIAYTLSAITYHLLSNPDKLAKLRAELKTAYPDPDSTPALSIVEHLPYLQAVVLEGLRINPGALVRMTRSSPDEDLVYHDKSNNKMWEIPRNTPITMSALLLQRHPSVFPEADKFEPERWQNNPGLKHYMIVFSRGTRMCLGFNLSYAELYVTLASLFLLYDLYDGTGKQQVPTLALYDTIRERDIDANMDFIAPAVARGSKGLQVVVRG
ncbi:uncharacterized protein N7503_000774 [Penicillium pulvis]|uniref:uncharacterized protein n=1 Tax=Penicillium pulvis TaxID=1562058 RepID=UPI0025485ECE|nr:uncharacterized protein N7503_000774 [Penicillium pulvis]KAJ5814024.1 hypothetical protein N7503_000774 [Penicillium pulvis]